MHIARFLLLSVFALCSPLLGAARFDVVGTVVQMRPESQSVVVAHEDIPGFMPAMTMPFRVLDPAELEGLKQYDRVQFVFVVGDDSSHAEAFRVLESPAPQQAPQAPTAAEAAPRKLKEGDTVPQVELVDQDGEPVQLTDEARWTVMTFIFTRCPVPEFCPRMSSSLRAVQDALPSRDLGGKVRLLSVTLDPEFDTPALLKEYGTAVGSDFDIWQYATGTQQEIDRLTSAFRVFVKENGVTLDHTLCTALIRPDGTIEKIWRGNAWTSDEVLSAIPATGGAVATQDR